MKNNENDFVDNVDKKNIQKDNIKSEKTKVVGILTCGVILIIFGVTMLLQTIFSIKAVLYIIKLWPILFVIFGIEMIYYSRKNKIIIDILSIIITLFIICSGAFIGAFNLAVDTFVSKDFNNLLSNLDNDFKVSRTFDGKVKIKNLSDSNINIVKKVDKDLTNTTVDIFLSSTNNEENSKDDDKYTSLYVIKNLLTNDLYNDVVNFDENTVYIKETAKKLDIKIVIYTNNEENIVE